MTDGTMRLSPAEATALARVMRSAKELHVHARSLHLRCQSAEDADLAAALLAKQGRKPIRIDSHRLTAEATGK